MKRKLKEVFEMDTEWLSKVGILIIELPDRIKKDCSMSLFRALTKYSYDFYFSGKNFS